ncbi:MAG: glycosyltransferase [Acidobacteriota bacterium]|nr:glycosyltransferase [Acidobacteriota bacterium]
MKAVLLVARMPGHLAGRAADAAAGRLMRPPRTFNADRYNLETPVLSSADFDLVENLLAEKKPVHDQTADAIQTSIIIAVFNKAEFTFSCLSSLIREIDFSRTEVIVIDNASTDNTEAVLFHFDDFVRVVKNERNCGFVDACNQGAAAARGKYLLFLNNDTKVLPGWLNHLVTTIEANPANGAVGSMFLYPDGSIQEAGAIVWKNGEAYHYGWGASPDDRHFNFAREVDYCSAASLLIRRDVFEKLGGFDRRFAPAYYEDIDLCFGVRSLGFRVIYQPLSRLVHYEATTAGGDINKGGKRFQIINREKFVEKWRDQLEREHLAEDLKRLEEASNRDRALPRIVVFDERIPSPDRDAGSGRMFIILKTLAKWAHVIFVPFNRPQGQGYEAALWFEGIETADTVDYRRLLKDMRVTAAIVSRPAMAEALIHRIRRANPQVKIVFDMVDSHFIRFEREYQITGDVQTLKKAQRYRKLERRMGQRSDLIWCASEEDRQTMEREVPGRRIEVVPTIHELRDRGRAFEERKDLLFIGNLAHRPNGDAILFFMREIYPHLTQTLPNVKLDIIGENVSDDISAFNSENVRIRGYVQDVKPYLRGCRIFIAPLRFGAGIKGKVGEAMSYGLPVVTTSIGAEGFGLKHGVEVMIADDPASFAAAVTLLYFGKELWESLAQNSRLVIEKHFIPEVVAESINSSLQ